MTKPSAPFAPLISSALLEDKKRALALISVSRETEARLDRYVDLLLQWQAKTNLIAPSTLPTVWTRHIADSLQLLKLIEVCADAGPKIWVDLGSGGGFPGVVVAAALAERADVTVHLVERTTKKAAFLREALRVTGSRGQVHPMDIGDFVDRFRETPDYISARALASLRMLFDFIGPIMGVRTRALLMKGQDVDSELTEATRYWKFEATAHQSLTDAGGKILEIQRLERLDGEGRGTS
jgi:16S rRNA (guanine527-N7)-methyltransferase